LIPALAKVLVEEFYVLSQGFLLCYLAYPVLTLPFAKEQGARPCIIFPMPCNASCGLHTPLIADPTSLAFSEDHASEELFQGVFVHENDGDTHLPGESFHGLQAVKIFLIGLNIGIEKKPSALMALLSKPLDRIACTVGTAYMEQNLHSFSRNRED
jgi:hypothetical protein